MNGSRAERALDLFARLRLVFLAAAMLAFAGAIGSAADVDAAAKAPSGFSVKPPGGGPVVTVTQAEIQGLPQESHDYKEPGNPDPVPHSGASLESVVDLAATKSAGGFLPGDVKYLTIKGPTGTVFLSDDEIFNPGSAYKEGFPALVGVDSGKTRFFRPQQTGGRGVVSLSDATIASKAFDGDILGVSVSSDADDDKAAEGTQVNFTADVSGPGSDGATIKWSAVGGGKKFSFGTGKTANTSFPKATSYVVYADVAGEDDSGGQGSLAFKVKGNKTSCPKSERPCDGGGGGGGAETDAARATPTMNAKGATADRTAPQVASERAAGKMAPARPVTPGARAPAATPTAATPPVTRLRTRPPPPTSPRRPRPATAPRLPATR